jgi:LPPG:FO 2-phospho-L-lactate transferase
LAIQQISDLIEGVSVPRIAVSPIIGGAALRGPAADMLKGLGHQVSATGVAQILEKYLDGFVLDEQDARLLPDLERLGLSGIALPTVMNDLSTKKALAEDVLKFAGALARSSSPS